MARDGYPSILLVADVALTELAAALGACLGTPHVTLYHWRAGERGADPMVVDVGSFELAAPFVRAAIVRHDGGDARMHIDIDYDLIDPPPLPVLCARLAGKLAAPVVYDAGDANPFAYRRVSPDGCDEPVRVAETDAGAAYLIRSEERGADAR